MPQAEAGHADEEAGLGHVPAGGVVVGTPRALAAQLAQDARHAHYRGEQDELLERVEAAVVEVHGGHHVRRRALGHGDPVEDEAVRAVVVPEVRQSANPHSSSPSSPVSATPNRLSRSRSLIPRPPRTFASASRIIIGSATAPTTVCESATSGAWKTKRMPSTSP